MKGEGPFKCEVSTVLGGVQIIPEKAEAPALIGMANLPVTIWLDTEGGKQMGSLRIRSQRVEAVFKIEHPGLQLRVYGYWPRLLERSFPTHGDGKTQLLEGDTVIVVLPLTFWAAPE